MKNLIFISLVLFYSCGGSPKTSPQVDSNSAPLTVDPNSFSIVNIDDLVYFKNPMGSPIENLKKIQLPTQQQETITLYGQGVSQGKIKNYGPIKNILIEGIDLFQATETKNVFQKVQISSYKEFSFQENNNDYLIEDDILKVQSINSLNGMVASIIHHMQSFYGKTYQALKSIQGSQFALPTISIYPQRLVLKSISENDVAYNEAMKNQSDKTPSRYDYNNAVYSYKEKSITILPESKSIRLGQKYPIWNNQFVLAHEYGHHIFSYLFQSTDEELSSMHIHAYGQSQLIDQKHLGIADTTNQTNIFLSSLNEAYADLYAYTVLEADTAKEYANDITIVGSLRDPDIFTIAKESSKGMTNKKFYKNYLQSNRAFTTNYHFAAILSYHYKSLLNLALTTVSHSESISELKILMYFAEILKSKSTALEHSLKTIEKKTFTIFYSSIFEAIAKELNINEQEKTMLQEAFDQKIKELNELF